jgi:hypothetical protein
LRDKWSAAYNAYLDKSLAIRTEEAVKLSYIQSKKWFSDNEQASKLKVIADQYQKEWYDWREANGLSRAPTS